MWESLDRESGEPDSFKASRNSDLIQRLYRHPHVECITYACRYGGSFKLPVLETDGTPKQSSHGPVYAIGEPNARNAHC